MRKPWILIAMILLVVGIAAAYRIGRVGKPHRDPVAAGGSVETSSGESGPREGSEPSARPAPIASESPAGTAAPRAPVGTDEARSTRFSEAELAGAPQDPVASPPEPARPDPGPTPQAPAHHDGGATPAGGPSRRPAPIPPSPPTPTAPPANELAKDDSKEDSAVAAAADDLESDRRPPVLMYLRFDPAEIRDGGVATLSVGASDDLAGVKFVFGTIRSPSEAAVVPFTAQDAGNNGVFTARIAIPRQAETGDWFVGSLQLVDKADNPLNLAFAKSTVPQGGALRVTSDESDATAPDVRRVAIDKGMVGAGEHNQIVVDVDDDRSGVASVTGTFQSPSRAAFIPFGCRPGGEGSWVGDVAIPADADCGEWTLRQLRVADKANNTAYLTAETPQVGAIRFVVSGGGGCDADPPVIDALYVSPAFVSNAAASEVSLIFTIHDDGSGVDSLSGRIEGPVSTDGQAPKIYFGSKPDPKDPQAPMTARCPVPHLAARGIWRVAFVQVMDKARNTRTYGPGDPALANASFMVE